MNIEYVLLNKEYILDELEIWQHQGEEVDLYAQLEIIETMLKEIGVDYI